jgi:16S rRNA (guanine527-N7)-methyltransferase
VSQSAIRAIFAKALTDGPAALPAPAIDRLVQHWELVKAWNARVNLTSILDDEEAAYRHYRDSLQALPLLPQGAIVDFGSGAGFPGIPLALAAPDRTFTLLEPRRKRVSFLEVAAGRLGLTNVRVVLGASGDRPDRDYDAGVTRATFSSADGLEECLTWLVPGAPLIAYRSDALGLPGAQVHPYLVRETRRVLEVYTRAR